MNRSIVIPRDKLEPFLLNMGFHNSSTDNPKCWDVTFSRAHHLNPNLRVTVCTTIPLGCNETLKNNRSAIEIVTLYNKTKVLYHSKVLRVNSVKSTLQRILREARKAYKACNKYYNTYYSGFYSDTQKSAPKTPAPPMVSPYHLGYLKGLREAARLLDGKRYSEAHEYTEIILESEDLSPKIGRQQRYCQIRNPISRLINDHILRIENAIKNNTPEVQ